MVIASASMHGAAESPSDRRSASAARVRRILVLLALSCSLACASSLTAAKISRAQPAPDAASGLAQKLQNPIGDLISVPFQNNFNLAVGPQHWPQNVMNIQPVVPVHLDDTLNLITRTILPVVWNGGSKPGHSNFGLGATTFSAFFSPRHQVNGWGWGSGPALQIPTATDTALGSNIWGMGPAVVVVKTTKSIVGGVLANDVISLGGTSGASGTRYNTLTINPFLNFNFSDGWFIGSVPIITANLDSHGAKWTLPIGLQGGRLIMLGHYPVNLLAGAYYNVLRQSYGGNWQLRAQFAFVF